MRAFGFQTLEVEDGNDIEAIGLAIEAAKADLSRPSFITIHTQIGYGCPKKMGTASAHGEPLGDENILEMKQFLNWPSTEPFFVPEEVYDNYRTLGEAHAKTEAEWQKLFDAYCAEFPEMKEKWDFWHDRKNVGKAIDNEEFWKGAEGDAATRNLSGATLNRAKDMLPQLFGGSADLAPSNKSRMNDTPDFSKDNYAGRNMHFGIREIAMAAIENGLALHGGLIPYCATFFVFSDYTKPMVRLASIMGLPTIYIFSHDSIGVGEDGPTHEPVEQTAMLRALPNFRLFRPADANETNAAWFAALTSEHTPTAIASTRQNLPQIEGTSREALKGGYVVQDSAKEVPDVILIASGSELQLAVGAKAELAKDGIDARVVSMPCMDLFEEQDEAYKEAVLPKKVRARVAVEALTTFGWDRYVGLDGKVIGMHGFGQSGPYKFLFPHYGFTVEKVVEAAKEVL